MLATVLLVLLTAAPPAADAAKLSASKSWDELYLKYSAANPSDYTAQEREAVAKALLEAGRGLEKSDPVLALSLAERSAAFHETADAWLLTGELSLKLDQPAAAAKALEKAVVLDPANDKAKMLRADLAFKEGDLLLAQNLYESVPKGSPHRASARAGLEKAKQARAAETERLAELHKIELDLAKRRAQAEKSIEERPLTLLDVCRVHAVATCQALQRCQPALAGGLGDCSTITGMCPESAEKAPVSRAELESCRAAIEKADCSKVTADTLADPTLITQACKVLERIGANPSAP